MPKKFEGHGSGEVEVKPAKMLLWENCLLDREVGDIRLIVELFRSGMRGHLLLPGFPLIMPKENISQLRNLFRPLLWENKDDKTNPNGPEP